MKTAPLATATLLLAGLLALGACTTRSSEALDQDHQNVIEEFEEAEIDRSSLPVGGPYTPQGILEVVADAGGLTKLPLATATDVLDYYIGELASVPAAALVVDDLQLVREEINSGVIDRGEVGAALNRLGAQTRLMAGDDAGYGALGSALKASGEQLVGDNMMD